MTFFILTPGQQVASQLERKLLVKSIVSFGKVITREFMRLVMGDDYRKELARIIKKRRVMVPLTLQEPVEVQRAVVTILSVLKTMAKGIAQESVVDR